MPRLYLMLKKTLGVILLVGLLFLGQKEILVFFCDTEINIEQVSYENAADTLSLPPDSLLQKPVILSITAHIVRKNNGTGGINESLVLNEIERANQAFAAAGISFEICTFSYINSNKFYNLTKYDEARLLDYNIENTINVYFVNQINTNDGKICGYTYYPTKNLDNVFLTNSCVPQGTTLIHELGHFFGLYHTHELQFGAELVSGANCKKAGDLICDTPADPGLKAALISESCEFTGFVTDVFNMAYSPPVRNYMSYSRQRCRDTFSPEQLFKMKLNYHYFKTHIKTLNTGFEVSDSIIVLGDSLFLKASGGEAYWWNTGDTTAQIAIAPDSTAIYSVNIVTDNGCNVFKKYTVEVIRENFIEAPDFVCAGEEATITLNDTKPGLIYMLSEPEGEAIYSAIGNGGAINIITNPIVSSTNKHQQYIVTILNPLTEQNWQLKKNLTIKVIPTIKSEQLSLLLPSDSICQGNIATVKILRSDPGLHYQLMEEERVIGNARKGNGDTLTLITAPIDTTVTYHLLAFNECSRIVKRNIISFTPFVPAATDTASVSFSLSKTIVNIGDSLSVLIENSNPLLSYQIMLNNKPIGKAVPGNEGVLILNTPPIKQTTYCCLVIFDRMGCHTTTEYPVVINAEDRKSDMGFTVSHNNVLTYALADSQVVAIKLYYLDGKEAKVIANGAQKKGEYRYVLDTATLKIPSASYMLRGQIDNKEVFRKIVSIY